MAMTDTIADMLTRIRNGQLARLVTITSPSSNLRVGVLEVLKREGYIHDFSEEQPQETTANKFKQLSIRLKYDADGKPVIREIKKVSKPGRRVYFAVSNLPKCYNGLGTAILSTPKGVMSDHEARLENVGGELICTVF